MFDHEANWQSPFLPPDNGRRVLVTVEFKQDNSRNLDFANYYAGAQAWSAVNTRQPFKIIKWMELPEPWKDDQ